MSITLDELIFDPANPDDGANVGATLRGADGTVIGNTGDALKVDIGAVADLDIRDLDAAQDNVAISDGTDTLEINADGSINATVNATDLDIRDLSFATDSVDVSGSNVNVSATDLDIRDLTFATDSVDVSNSTNVGVTATDLDIRDLSFATDSVDVSGSEVKDDAFGSFQNSAQTITNTASQIAATPLTDRRNITIQNLGNRPIFLGNSNAVTDSTGIRIPRGASVELKAKDTATLWALTPNGTADVRILESAY